MVTCKCQVSQVVFSGTGMDPSQKVDHRDKNLQFQLFSMEHGRRGYPLRNKTMADCEQEAAAKFGNAQVHTPLSVHFTPDKSSQYIVCDGVAAYLPASAAGTVYEAHNHTDTGKVFLSDGVTSFYPDEIIQAAREAKEASYRATARKSNLPAVFSRTLFRSVEGLTAPGGSFGTHPRLFRSVA